MIVWSLRAAACHAWTPLTLLFVAVHARRVQHPVAHWERLQLLHECLPHHAGGHMHVCSQCCLHSCHSPLTCTVWASAVSRTAGVVCLFAQRVFLVLLIVTSIKQQHRAHWPQGVLNSQMLPAHH